jgi:hypothetical protein
MMMGFSASEETESAASAPAPEPRSASPTVGHSSRCSSLILRA